MKNTLPAIIGLLVAPLSLALAGGERLSPHQRVILASKSPPPIDATFSFDAPPVDFGFDYYFGFDAPWATANKFKGKSGVGQYGDYVMNVDAMIGQVLATLEQLKLKADLARGRSRP